jgi:hypothetical protein
MAIPCLLVHREETHPQELREAPRSCSTCPTCSRRRSSLTSSFCRPRPPRRAQARRPAGRVQSIFPIVLAQPDGAPRVRQLRARQPGVRRQGVPAARPDLLRAPARPVRLVIMDKRSRQADRQGGEGAGGVHGRDSAHDHQPAHSSSTAPSASSSRSCTGLRACSSSTTAARPTARASCCSRRGSFPIAARGSTSSSIPRTCCTSASTVAARCRSRSC